MKPKHPLVFVCPLDWGIGHASRVIPIIHQLTASGYDVMLGGSGKSGELLKTTFPKLPFLAVKSNEIRYNLNGHWLGLSLILQIPAMLISAFREHRTIKKLVAKFGIGIIISDNRYGLYCKSTYNIFITHQISPVLPVLLKWVEFPLYCVLRIIIQRFDECWIPDYSDKKCNFSGRLSHRFKLPDNARFIGPLSRFNTYREKNELHHNKKYQLVAILSGPQPQLKLFTNLIITQASRDQINTLIIAGLQEEIHASDQADLPFLTIVGHLEQDKFRKALLSAEQIICRSGYSGIMDLIALEVTAVLIPTPGQTEQEYLARYLSEKGLFKTIKQQHFQLKNVMAMAGSCQPSIYNGLIDIEKLPIPLDKENKKHN